MAHVEHGVSSSIVPAFRPNLGGGLSAAPCAISEVDTTPIQVVARTNPDRNRNMIRREMILVMAVYHEK